MLEKHTKALRASGPEVRLMEALSTEAGIAVKTLNRTEDLSQSKLNFKTGERVEFTATPINQTVPSVSSETNLHEKEKEDLINNLKQSSGHYVKDHEYFLFKGGNPIPDAENVSSEIASCEKCGKVLLIVFPGFK